MIFIVCQRKNQVDCGEKQKRPVREIQELVLTYSMGARIISSPSAKHLANKRQEFSPHTDGDLQARLTSRYPRRRKRSLVNANPLLNFFNNPVIAFPNTDVNSPKR
jgi:hypothetical protein